MLKLKYDKIGKSYKNINHLLNIHWNGWLWFQCCITCISSYWTGALRGNQEPNRLLVWSRFLQVDAWFGDQRQTQTEWRKVRPLLQLCVHTGHIYESNIIIILSLVLVIRMNQLIHTQEIWWRFICALNPYFNIDTKNPLILTSSRNWWTNLQLIYHFAGRTILFWNQWPEIMEVISFDCRKSNWWVFNS